MSLVIGLILWGMVLVVVLAVWALVTVEVVEWARDFHREGLERVRRMEGKPSNDGLIRFHDCADGTCQDLH